MKPETPTMRRKRQVADVIYKQRQRRGYRRMIWNSSMNGTYVRGRD